LAALLGGVRAADGRTRAPGVAGAVIPVWGTI
jgi:hypothetical protein